MKKKTKIIFAVFIISVVCVFTACNDGRDYTCGYCGREMEHYYDYINGEYTCYSCSKALRN